MDRTLIQRYATSMVNSLLAKAEALAPLEHGGTKGQLRELFVTEILRRYLTSQFGIGSGIIINQRGDQSQQTDIILYDRRILPPFIQEQGLGVYPVEAVIDAIEVKSRLEKCDLRTADAAAKKLKELARTGSIYQDNLSRKRPAKHVRCQSSGLALPGTSVFGFEAQGLSMLECPERGREWLCANMTTIRQLCVAGRMSWFKRGEVWQYHAPNDYYEETKRYLAVFLDNVRTHAERNYQELAGKHRDWLSVYIRDHPGNKEFLESIP